MANGSLRWILDQEEVSCVIPGFKTLKPAESNLQARALGDHMKRAYIVSFFLMTTMIKEKLEQEASTTGKLNEVYGKRDNPFLSRHVQCFLSLLKLGLYAYFF